MMSRTRRRPLAVLVTLLFLLAPTVARAAHDRAHERDFGTAAASVDDHQHGHDHEPPPHPHPASTDDGWPAAGRDHADSHHQTASLDDGLTCRFDCFAAAATIVRALSLGTAEFRPPPPPAAERRGEPTHHPPALPRAPPQR